MDTTTLYGQQQFPILDLVRQTLTVFIFLLDLALT